MASLYLSDNSKTKFTTNHRNTFGLMYGLPENGGTCPGATTGKGGCLDIRDGNKRPTCYMAKVTQIYKAVGKRLEDNTNLLKGKNKKEMEEILTATVEEFKKSNKNQNLFFRLHYSGDFFSADYAKAWSKVISKFPEIQFWVYSRSHNYAKYFVDNKNLTFYFSVDPANAKTGKKIYDQFAHLPNFGMAMMSNDAQIEGIKFVTCPETSGVIKNTNEAGACSKCRLCVDNYKDKVRHIRFKIH